MHWGPYWGHPSYGIPARVDLRLPVNSPGAGFYLCTLFSAGAWISSPLLFNPRCLCEKLRGPEVIGEEEEEVVPQVARGKLGGPEVMWIYWGI